MFSYRIRVNKIVSAELENGQYFTAKGIVTKVKIKLGRDI
jgi:hypothetical protein